MDRLTVGQCFRVALCFEVLMWLSVMNKEMISIGGVAIYFALRALRFNS